MLWALLAAAAAVALAAGAARLLARWGTDDDEPGGTTASHAGSIISALFSLLFAIAVIVPWTVADSARQNTHAEAQALVEAYWSAGGLPPAERAEVRATLTGYTGYVVDREWPYMVANEDVSPTGWERIDGLRARVAAYRPADKDAQNARDDVTDDLRDVYAARRQRASDAGSGLPAGVLVFTVLTGALMIVYPLLAGARPRGLPVVTLFLSAALLGIALYLAFDIDHAFSGALGVDPGAFTTAIREYARIP